MTNKPKAKLKHNHVIKINTLFNLKPIHPKTNK